MSLTSQKYNLVTILGPTATGKTSVATHLANKLNGEVISADSRQVYRGMDLGTGKDIEDYTINGQTIPYHLIDIVDSGYEYNVFEYQRDFVKAFNNIKERNKQAILCGGSGMYIEAVLKGYKLINVPVNDKLRQSLLDKTLDELTLLLRKYKSLHNTTDIDTVKRAVRAIEIEEYYLHHDVDEEPYPEINSLLIGIDVERAVRRNRITKRLQERLNEGMVDEVKNLLEKGNTPEQLIYYGLEYKFITQYIVGELTYDEMVKLLNIAIHQFAKRQMTWYRRMERNGFKIHWIDGLRPMEEKIAHILTILNV